MGTAVLPKCQKCGKEIEGTVYYWSDNKGRAGGPTCADCSHIGNTLDISEPFAPMIPKADGKCCFCCPNYYTVCYPITANINTESSPKKKQ